MQKGKETLIELIIGIAFFCLIFMVFGFILSHKVSFILGVLLGGAISALIACHMLSTIEKAMDLGEEGAVSYTRKQSFLRVLMMCLCIGLAFTFPEVFHVVGTLLGLFTLKFGALFNPVIHKLLSRFTVDKGR